MAGFEFMGDRYAVIDCPGSPEFSGCEDYVLPAVDLAIIVADPNPARAALLQPIFKELEQRRVPHAVFVNKIDQAHGPLDDLLAAILELVLPQTDLLIVEHLRLAQWHADGDIDIGDAPSPMHALVAAGAEWVLVLGSPQRPGHHANVLLGPNGQTTTLPWQAPPDRNGDAGGLAATAITAQLARGLEMPEAVRQGLAHADAAVAARGRARQLAVS